MTDGWLDQLVALACAKTGDIGERGDGRPAVGSVAGSGDPRLAQTDDIGERGDGRPAVGSGAGSGDPRPAREPRPARRDELSELAERHNVRIIGLGGQGGEEGPADMVDGHPGPSPAGRSAELVSSSSGCAPPYPRSRRGGIGLVGPMSNYAAPPQLVEGALYQDLHEMPAFARRWRDEHRGQWFTVPKLSGFCLLMKRAVYDKIGGLDERFGMGFFDDDDLAERARRAGFELAVAHDLFVHHFGSRTFAGNGIDAERLLDENAERFAAKWGLRETGGRRVALRPFVESTFRDSSSINATNPTRQRGTPRSAPGNGTPLAGASGWYGSAPASADRLPTEPPSSAAPGNGTVPSLARRVGMAPTLASADELPPALPVAAADRARVSLTMIVRDEEKNLPHCLDSVRDVFDEIVVVDTGSKDRTVEIARSFGARVFDFVWVDDFAAARNEALSHATGDYVFWLDADDVVEPAEKEKLRALLGSLTAIASSEDILSISAPRTEPVGFPPPGGFLRSALQRKGPPEGGTPTGAGPPTRTESVGVPPLGGFLASRPYHNGPPEGGTPTAAAYVVRCACDPSPDGTGGETVVDHIRLFPLRDDVRWTYRVHEQILPALRKANVPVRWTDLKVRHTGYVDPALRARKLQRDHEILKHELEHRPGDPFVLFNLGAIASERRDWQEAIRYLERSLAGSAPTDSIVRKLFALIARAHQMLGDSRAALNTCLRGLQVDPDDAELWFRRAVVHRHRGESAEAEQCWRRILGLLGPTSFVASTRGSMGISPAATWRPWPPSAVITQRSSGCGTTCSPSAPGIVRRL